MPHFLLSFIMCCGRLQLPKLDYYSEQETRKFAR